MKTLANCTPGELVVQICKISDRIKNYRDGISKIKKIAAPGTASLKDEKGRVIEKTDVLGIINYICGDNADETMALCGDICFMTAEEFAALDPAKGDPDGITEVLGVFDSPRVLAFFTTSLKLKSFFAAL